MSSGSSVSVTLHVVFCGFLLCFIYLLFNRSQFSRVHQVSSVSFTCHLSPDAHTCFPILFSLHTVRVVSILSLFHLPLSVSFNLALLPGVNVANQTQRQSLFQFVSSLCSLSAAVFHSSVTVKVSLNLLSSGCVNTCVLIIS